MKEVASSKAKAKRNKHFMLVKKWVMKEQAKVPRKTTKSTNCHQSTLIDISAKICAQC